MPRATVNVERRAIAAWCVYDWANSAFTTLVVTFVYATYFSQTMTADKVAGTALWSRGIAVSAVLVALMSPLLGAIADRTGRRRRYLLSSTLICVAATAALTFVVPGGRYSALLALAVFVVANVAFEAGMVFYNAFLPDIAPPERIGRVSGYGWALGYGGGLACMAVALAVLARDVPLFGIPTTAGFNIRATNLLVSAWFLLFSLPIFLFVRDRPPPAARRDRRGAIGDLVATFRHIRRYREAVKFLVARLIYNDGLVTVFAFGGIYAGGTFGMGFREVLVFGIVLNLAAGLGALAFGYIDDLIGGRGTILISLVALSAATLAAVLAPGKAWLWVAAILIGLFIGPNQSASRSLMGRFVPQRHQSEFFGFFAFSGKITSFAGPILLGIVTQVTGSQRAGVATILIFFIVGGALLLSVNEQRGLEEAERQNRSAAVAGERRP